MYFNTEHLSYSRLLLCFSACALLSVGDSSIPARGADIDKGFKGVSRSITVKASPQACYEAIHHLRKQAVSTVKELSKTEGDAILEETFLNLPFVGKAVCTYEERYVPGKSIEYKMIRSDKFKAFEGKWELNETAEKMETEVRLSSFVLLDLPIPFLRQITNTQTLKGVKERLNAVKTCAEKRTHALSSSDAAPSTETQ